MRFGSGLGLVVLLFHSAACRSEGGDDCVQELVFADLDGDGFGGDAVLASSCESAPDTVAEGGDCDDADPQVHPDAVEVCNGYRDDDCDGLVDDLDPTVDPSGMVSSSGFVDLDGDGYAGSPTTVTSCAPPDLVAVATDCDDAAAEVHPGRNEVCNGIDDDCDGAVDAADAALDLSTAYADVGFVDDDGDGWGVGDEALHVSCEPLSVAEQGGDCDDTNPLAHPAAPEVCNGGVDDDCDGLADDDDDDTAFPTHMGYFDDDGDGYGGPYEVRSDVCELVDIGAFDDCVDHDPSIPEASEVCYDGIDNDCVRGSGTCPPPASGGHDDVHHVRLSWPSSNGVPACADSRGDLDGDGYDDLLIVGFDREYEVWVLLDPSWTTTSSLTAHPRGPIMGPVRGAVTQVVDVNGDGHVDLATSTYISPSYLDVYLGPLDAAAGLPTAELYEGRGGRLLDIDGDGTMESITNTGLEVAIYSYPFDTAPVAVHDGQPQWYGLDGAAMVDDTNGDGHDDVILAFSGATVLVDGASLLSPPAVILQAFAAEPWLPIDVDGDGVVELREVEFGTSRFRYHFLDGRPPLTVPSIWHPAGDLDGDGVGDLIAAEVDDDYTSGTAFTYLGTHDGTAVQPVATYDSAVSGGMAFVPDSKACAVGDTDGDGFDDVLAITGWGGEPFDLHLIRGGALP